MEEQNKAGIQFNIPQDKTEHLIKVIGVGGGGGNPDPDDNGGGSADE